MQVITINYDISTLITGGIALAGILLSALLTYHFTKKRKIDELLFSARKEAYTEFMKNFGMAFGPETFSLEGFNEIKALETNYERDQRVARIFAQCRLLANPFLEDRLRYLYDLIIEGFEKSAKKDKNGKSERDYVGYEVEALMRRDMHVVGDLEVFMWRIFSAWKRFKLKKK
jgi:hypothetical protein